MDAMSRKIGTSECDGERCGLMQCALERVRMALALLLTIIFGQLYIAMEPLLAKDRSTVQGETSTNSSHNFLRGRETSLIQFK